MTSSLQTDGWTISLPDRYCPQSALLHAARALNCALSGDQMRMLLETETLRRLGFHVLCFEAEHQDQQITGDFLMWAWIAKQYALVRTFALSALQARLWPGHQFSNSMARILEIEPEGSMQLRIVSELFEEYLRWMCEQHGADCLLEHRSEAIEGPRGEAMLLRVCGQVLSAKEAAALSAATPCPASQKDSGRRL